MQLKPQTGPILITTDHDIGENDDPAFLDAMTLRRRIRKRDGARHWSLLRDLEQPNIWTEKYHVANWVEYIRHNQHRTKSDSGVSDTLNTLHQGTEAPRVRRMIERQTVPKQADPCIKNVYKELR